MRWTRTIERLVCDRIRSGMTQVEIDADAGLPSMIDINRRRQVNERFNAEYDKADEARLLAWYERSLEDIKLVEAAFEVAMEEATSEEDIETRARLVRLAAQEKRTMEVSNREKRDFLKFCLNRRAAAFAPKTSAKTADKKELPEIRLVNFGD